MNETKEIIDLMIKSSGNNPYGSRLSYKDNLVAAIELATLCKDFADKGHSNEAMNIPSEKWVEVIEGIDNMLINI